MLFDKEQLDGLITLALMGWIVNSFPPMHENAHPNYVKMDLLVQNIILV
jgi:hypothetical protein